MFVSLSKPLLLIKKGCAVFSNAFKEKIIIVNHVFFLHDLGTANRDIYQVLKSYQEEQGTAVIHK